MGGRTPDVRGCALVGYATSCGRQAMLGRLNNASQVQVWNPRNHFDGTPPPVAHPDDDVSQNIFSEQATSQWGWTWGQFLDHTFGLAQGGTGTGDNIPFNASDPVERFTDTLGVIPFTRDAVAPGTGTSTANPRQQINTV